MEEGQNHAGFDFETYNQQLDFHQLAIFTRSQLAKYNGKDKPAIYVAIKGYIYDVTHNKKAYGEGKSYNKFVGKDVGGLLGRNIIQEKETDGLAVKEPWDLSELTEKQLETVEKWRRFFSKRYKIVGLVVDHF